MKKNDKQKGENDISLPLTSSSDLRSRQSVRATFKLTEKAIETISIVAFHMGIKQKSLFDHLIEDARSLNSIARDIKHPEFRKQDRIQKTYVISRKTLSCLEKVSKNFGTPRDALVEYSIKRLMPVITEERAKHRERKKILGEITEYLKQGEKILLKSREILGENDPVCCKFENAMAACCNAHSSIKSFVERGKIIEDF